ncbi:hypothetical protein SBOR_4760 [Sclerotinia borealis F-4128]|uniref:Uncharacterized protein n=1 Tax=Sclerotinia borealis (strain F-4128) TaxID=1432307 RepID=W9CJQ7_SCLBF|nr:hypothetical protein SBOR_4760 [Sclerotinia borealis F-4128]
MARIGTTGIRMRKRSSTTITLTPNADPSTFTGTIPGMMNGICKDQPYVMEPARTRSTGTEILSGYNTGI